MKIYEGRNDSGQLCYFEVDNILIGRSKACRIVESIPGVTLSKRHRPWRFEHDEVFCVFTLNGKTFEIWEPFGDNSRYHVGETKAAWSPELEALKKAFASHVPFGLTWLRA